MGNVPAGGWGLFQAPDVTPLPCTKLMPGLQHGILIRRSEWSSYESEAVDPSTDSLHRPAGIFICADLPTLLASLPNPFPSSFPPFSRSNQFLEQGMSPPASALRSPQRANYGLL